MKFASVILLSLLGVTACSENNPDRPKNIVKKAEKYEAIPTSANTEVKRPEASDAAPLQTTLPAVDLNQVLLMTSFEVEGVPKGMSDANQFEIKVKADPAISHFSYKLSTPEDCKMASGYQVEPITSVVQLDVEKMPDGPVALCMLRFLAIGKLWQKTENATILSWQKIPFVRSIKSQFEEYDGACGKKLITQTVVKFSGSQSTYSWVRDSKAQGCNQPKAMGEDKLSITSNDDNEIKGFWSYEGGTGSGWFAFKWKTKERNTFDGSYGYGDPSFAPAGPWNSVIP